MCPVQADLALRSLGLDQKTVKAVWKENLESHDWLQWKQKGISLEDFCVLYAEAKHRSLGLAQAQSRGLLSATAEHVRGGLQRMAGELIQCMWLYSITTPAPRPSPLLVPHHSSSRRLALVFSLSTCHHWHSPTPSPHTLRPLPGRQLRCDVMATR